MSGTIADPLEPLEVRLLLSAATINWNTTYQTIDGFGASSAWSSGTWSSTSINLLFSPTTGAGLTLIRSRLAPNGTTSENLIMEQAAAYGVRAWTTPWTMPREWKSNTDTNNGGSLLPQYYQAYANDLADYVQDITRQGVPLYALSLQNEPNFAPNYESATWSAAQFDAFMKVVGPTFAARGITTKIMFPESDVWSATGGLAGTTMSDSAAAPYVGIIGGHNYGSPNYANYSSYSRPIWETEVTWSSGATVFDDAMLTADDIFNYMTKANANAYHYWWLNASGTSGLINGTTASPILWAMGQYSRFIRPGWVRMGETDDGGLDISTYKDPLSGKFATVVVNTSTNAVNESFTLNGVTASSVTPYVTSATENMAQYANISLTNGNNFSFSVAGRSIVTFTGISAAAPTLQAPDHVMAAPVQGNMSSQMTVSWSDNSQSETAYQVERSTDNKTWTIATSSLPAGSLSYTDTGLSENTQYFYRVKPTNGDSTTYSAVTTASTIMNAPSGVGGTRVSNGIVVTWNINSTVSSGVTLDRSTDGITWNTIATLGARATDYYDVIPSYSSSQTYYYRVRNSLGPQLSAFASWNTGLAAPAGFTAAQVNSTSVVLTWNVPATGAFGAWIYQNGTAISPTSLVASAGTYTVTGLTANTSYTFSIKFTADADNVSSSTVALAAITTPFQPIWYKANENSGTTLNDSFLNADNGTLSGSFSFSVGVNGNALNLTGGAVTMPNSVVNGVNDFTIATWVKVSSLADGARIFDFGTGTANTMYLVAQAAGTAGLPQFAITTSSGTQTIGSSVAITSGVWTHIAVTLSGNTATLYINGAVAGTNSATTIHPNALGATTADYLGKSEGTDPNLLGSLDDFQIWGRAFSQAEIQNLVTGSSLLAWYKADETLGAVLSDSSGSHNNAVASTALSFAPGISGNAVSLAAGAANVPDGIVGGLNDFTISTWVKVTTLDNWARVFDFGTSTTNYMFLSLKPGTTTALPRFAINTGSGEEVINSTSTTVTTNTWYHIAVTLSGNTGTLYIDGVAVGTNTNMTYHPGALGATTNNYIGDSQFTADPLLNGSIDDFRIYSRALSAAEIAQLALPTVATVAAATPNPTSTTTTALSVLGADATAGETALIYTWAATGSPPAPVTFNVNGTNASKSTTATFAKSGTYTLQVSIVNGAAAGVAALSKTSTVIVTVNQTTSAVSIAPASVNQGGTATLTATALDQFGFAMATQPSGYTWSVVSGAGSVTPLGANTGTFTAGNNTEAVVVQAVIGTSTGTGSVAVTSNLAPSILTGPLATPNPVTGTTAALSVTATDAAGEPSLTYLWSITGTPPAPVTFSINGTNAAKNTTATFTKAGSYNFQLKITDPSGYYTIKTLALTVNQTQALAVIPATNPALANTTDQITGKYVDQFGTIMSGTPAVTFSLTSGPGSISSTGLYTAASTSGTAVIHGVAGSLTANLSLPVGYQELAWYQADTSATTLTDSSGHNNTATLSGTLNSNYNFTAGVEGTALHLISAATPAAEYATLPAGIVSSLTDFTIATWVKVDTLNTWSRIFDFGTGQTVNMYLTTRTASGGPVRFAITTGGSGAEQQLNGPVLAAGVWYQITITLVGNVGTMYVNGAAVAVNTSMTLHPSSLGVTTQNYLGKSQYSDPGFQGSIDDFRIIGRGLSPSEVLALALPTFSTSAVASPPTVTGTTSSLSTLAADITAGESALTYTWSTAGYAPGTVSFSINNTNAAKNTTATFTAPGAYTFKVSALNPNTGNVVNTSWITVNVVQTATALAVTPGTVFLNDGGTTLLTARLNDQFGTAMPAQPSITWSIPSGGGTQSPSGNTTTYTAGQTSTIATVQAVGSTFTGSATVTVTNLAPTVATAAAATPGTVVAASTALSVMGADGGGEANLTYTWTTTGTPPAAVTFSANGTNAAKNTIATFTKAGIYSFLVTIKDGGNLSTTSTVNVTVSQTLTTIVLTPTPTTIASGQTQQFTATANDQFTNALVTQPNFTWTLASGTGSVSSSGLYTAGYDAANPAATVRATSGSIFGSASVIVTNASPTISMPAGASSSPVTGTSTTLSAVGNDIDGGGEPNLTYTWTTTGSPPAAVTFGPNGTNASKNISATFTQAGTYNFQVTIQDLGGLSVVSTLQLVVAQTPTSIAFSGEAAALFDGQQTTFTAAVNDQFGAAMASPSVTWSLDGGSVGSVAGGVYTAPASGIGTAVVRATSGSTTISATVNVILSVIAGTSSGDVIRLMHNPSTGLLDVFINSQTASYSADTTVMTDLTISPQDGANTIILDFTNGSPLPAGMLTLDGSNSVSSTLQIIGAQTAFPLTLANGPFSIAAPLSLDSLALTGSASVDLAAGGANTLSVNSLLIGPDSGLDLNDNNMAIQAASPAAAVAALAAIVPHLAAGRAGGAWNGIGLSSSSAYAQYLAHGSSEYTALAAAINSSLPSPYMTTFSNVPVTLNSVLLKYTYAGDATLDSVLNIDDYLALDFGYLFGRSGYANGGFDYGPSITAADFAVLDTNINRQDGILAVPMVALTQVPFIGSAAAATPPVAPTADQSAVVEPPANNPTDQTPTAQPSAAVTPVVTPTVAPAAAAPDPTPPPVEPAAVPFVPSAALPDIAAPITIPAADAATLATPPVAPSDAPQAPNPPAQFEPPPAALPSRPPLKTSFTLIAPSPDSSEVDLVNQSSSNHRVHRILLVGPPHIRVLISSRDSTAPGQPDSTGEKTRKYLP